MNEALARFEKGLSRISRRLRLRLDRESHCYVVEERTNKGTWDKALRIQRGGRYCRPSREHLRMLRENDGHRYLMGRKLNPWAANRFIEKLNEPKAAHEKESERKLRDSMHNDFGDRMSYFYRTKYWRHTTNDPKGVVARAQERARGR